MHDRNDRIAEEIRRLSGEFLSRESNRLSLITVTRILLSRDTRKATICISIFPPEKEKAALEFSARHAGDLREYMKKHSRLPVIPHLTFQIDKTEENGHNTEG